MPKGKRITEEIRRAVYAHWDSGMNKVEIGKRVNHPKQPSQISLRTDRTAIRFALFAVKKATQAQDIAGGAVEISEAKRISCLKVWYP